jgi:hypothetical protein
VRVEHDEFQVDTVKASISLCLARREFVLHSVGQASKHLHTGENADTLQGSISVYSVLRWRSRVSNQGVKTFYKPVINELLRRISTAITLSQPIFSHTRTI